VDKQRVVLLYQFKDCREPIKIARKYQNFYCLYWNKEKNKVHRESRQIKIRVLNLKIYPTKKHIGLKTAKRSTSNLNLQLLAKIGYFKYWVLEANQKMVLITIPGQSRYCCDFIVKKNLNGVKLAQRSCFLYWTS
jgi:hypothetical protein